MVGQEAMIMYTESDPRVLAVLERALRSGSRPTRLRAVAMLARVACEPRARWLTEACGDPESAVREMAQIVAAWVAIDGESEWPQREDPAFDALAPMDLGADAQLEHAAHFRWQWEYALEVWREDGLLVGVYLATTCEEDDEHAKRIALGHAILASTSPLGERFDPALAAVFIVGKRRVKSDAESRRT
jgi:hypothetical protein